MKQRPVTKRWALAPRAGLVAGSVLLLGQLTSWCPAVWAADDDVLQSIKEAREHYEQQAYGEAVNSLNYAIGKIREKQSTLLQDALPAPLPGWQAEAAEGQFAGMAVFGGGVTVSRKYTHGEESVEIDFLTESPLIQTMTMLVTNPAFAAQQPNSKLTKIKGNSAVEKWDGADQSGEITIVVKNMMLVSVKGSSLSTVDPLRQYAEAVDFTKLKAFLAQ